jgi:hypothetical protein
MEPHLSYIRGGGGWDQRDCSHSGIGNVDFRGDGCLRARGYQSMGWSNRNRWGHCGLVAQYKSFVTLNPK